MSYLPVVPSSPHVGAEVTLMSSFASARWIQQARKEGCWQGSDHGDTGRGQTIEGNPGGRHWGTPIMPKKRQDILKIEGLLSARLRTGRN